MRIGKKCQTSVRRPLSTCAAQNTNSAEIVVSGYCTNTYTYRQFAQDLDVSKTRPEVTRIKRRAECLRSKSHGAISG